MLVRVLGFGNPATGRTTSDTGNITSGQTIRETMGYFTF